MSGRPPSAQVMMMGKWRDCPFPTIYQQMFPRNISGQIRSADHPIYRLMCLHLVGHDPAL